MKKFTRGLFTSVVALSLALAPAVSASAAPSQIGTMTQQWDYHYSSPVTSDGNIQAVIDYNNDEVYLVNKTTLTITQVADPNNDFDGVYYGAFSPDGTKLYVTNYNVSSVSIIDVATATVTSSPDFVLNPVGIGVSPDGTRLVLTTYANEVAVFDLTSNSYAQIGSTVATGSSTPFGVFFTNASTALVVSEYGELNTVNLNDGSVSAAFGDGSAYGYGACASPDMSTIYMPNYVGASLYVISASTGAVSEVDLSSQTATGSLALCAVTSQNKVLITDWGLNSEVLVVDGSTKQFVTTISLSGLQESSPYPGLTDGISIMSGCQAYVDGYYGNVAQIQLDEDYCDAASEALPNTGVDTVAMSSAAAGGLALVALGALAVVRVRRRITNV